MKVISGLVRSYVLPLLLFGMSPAFAQTPGTEDTSFDIASLPQSFPALGVQPDGKILVATGIPTGGGLTLRRYEASGAPDSSFSVSGSLAEPVGVPFRILADPLGRIYVAGTYRTQYASPDSVRNETGTVIVRFLANGTFDTSFGAGGYLRHSYFVETNPSSPSSPPVVREEGVSGTTGVADFGLLPDGRLLVVGGSRSNANALLVARYNVDGRLDTSFGANGSREVGLGETLEQFVLQVSHDGSSVVLGRGPGSVDVVMKLTAQGTLDSSFGGGGKVRVVDNATYQYYVSDFEIQPDGKIVLGGSRTAGAEGADSLLARLGTSGALDASFGSGGVIVHVQADNDVVHSVELERNGKILVAGTAQATGGGPQSWGGFLFRALPNGQLDSGFQQQNLGASSPFDPESLAVSHAAYLLSAAANGQVAVRKFFIDPAPRNGSLSTGAPSTTGFGFEALTANGVPVDSATTSQLLGLHAYIYPQGADDGVSADIFVVVSTMQGWYMKTSSGAFIPWSGRVADLVPADENVPLAAMMPVSVYGGSLPFAGTYAVYTGYMTDGGPLIYTDTPGVLSITQ